MIIAKLKIALTEEASKNSLVCRPLPPKSKLSMHANLAPLDYPMISSQLISLCLIKSNAVNNNN